jgi:hypothetical protein
MEPVTDAPRKKVQRKLSTDELRQLLDRTRVEQTVDTVEGAALLGVTPQTMRRWACYGEGPIQPRRVFGRLRWVVADIKSVLTQSMPA